MDLGCSPSLSDGGQPPTICWQAMFQQLKDYQDLGHRKAPPPRIARWMAAQRRQYRVYGIGKKTPVGIIKQRVKKLNSVGFSWDVPANVDGVKRTEDQKKKSKIKHNLITSIVGMKSRNMEEFGHAIQTGKYDVEDAQTAGSFKRRVRMPNRRMQEFNDKNFQTDDDDDVVDDNHAPQVKLHEDDVSNVTSGNGTTSKIAFPGKLLNMVNELNDANPDILEWLPDGAGFRINDENAVVKEIKSYFRHNKLNSLIRQLNLYGFTKTRDDEGRAEFRHPQFTRDSTIEQVNFTIDRFGKAVIEPPKPTRTAPTRHAKPVEPKPVKTKANPQQLKSVVRQVGTIGRPSGKAYIDVGKEERYVKQLCKTDGCLKYIAAHCEGHCMSHYNELNGIQRSRERGPYKMKNKPAPQAPKEKPVDQDDRPKNRDTKPEPQPPSPRRGSPRSPEKKRKRASPSPELTASGRKKPSKSLYPHSKQNEFHFPTGQALAHLPSDPAPEFGPGWTTRTLMRPRPTPGKTKMSDTYFYSPVHQFKFRSRRQVEIFLECVKKVGGDEGKAIVEFKRVSNG